MGEDRDRRPNLHELAEYFRSINQAIVDLGGEVTAENEAEVDGLLELLDEARGDIDDKIDAIRPILSRNAAEAEYYEEEADRYYAMSRSYAATVARLKKWMIDALDRAGLKSAGRIIPQQIYTNGGLPSVEWELIGEPIPEGFRRVKTEVELDKAAVYRYLELGLDLPRGIKVARGRNIRDAHIPKRKGGKRASRSRKS
jgi:hypothetical protein